MWDVKVYVGYEGLGWEVGNGRTLDLREIKRDVCIAVELTSRPTIRVVSHL